MKPKILFIDDDEKLLAGLKRILYACRDSWEMIFLNRPEQVYARLEQQKVDVVVLDISMPGRSGFDILQHIKSRTELRDIEVIMLTGLKQKDLKRKALDWGATDLINKPVSKEDLIARIQSVLRIKEYRDILIEKNRQLEDQLIKSQRMQIVGTLAAGVVHDLKNIFSIIRGYPDIIRLRMEKDKPIDRQLEKIKGAVDRATKLAYQILNLSRADSDSEEVCSLNDIINEAYGIIQPTLPNLIDIHFELSDDPSFVKANPTQLIQVLLNLILNAKEAIPQGTAGRIAIRLQTIQVADDSECRKGTYHQITVSDNGEGIDQGSIERIFKSRYTTKDSEGGCGLGLYIIQTIVKRHGGYLNVESELKEGTVFNIKLPAHDRE